MKKVAPSIPINSHITMVGKGVESWADGSNIVFRRWSELVFALVYRSPHFVREAMSMRVTDNGTLAAVPAYEFWE